MYQAIIYCQQLLVFLHNYKLQFTSSSFTHNIFRRNTVGKKTNIIIVIVL